MLIQDAIKSGLPFKRKSQRYWIVEREDYNDTGDNICYQIEEACQYNVCNEPEVYGIFNKEDILAIDWEVKGDYTPPETSDCLSTL